MAKLKTFNEHTTTSEYKNEQELISLIEDLINNEVYLRNTPYRDDMEKDPDSVTAAAEAIVNMLKEQGLINF